MTDLNRILTLERHVESIPNQIEDWTDLCLSFCASVLQNIAAKVDAFPLTHRAFLKLVINNTREDQSDQLGLADMFVLSDFLFQKWIAYGFRLSIVKIKESGRVTKADTRLLELVRAA